MSKHLSWSRYFSLNPDSISSKDNSERVSANSCQGNLLLVFLILLIPVSTQVVLVTLSGMAESRTIPKGFDIFFFFYISIYYIYAINIYIYLGWSFLQRDAALLKCQSKFSSNNNRHQASRHVCWYWKWSLWTWLYEHVWLKNDEIPIMSGIT